MSEIFWHDHDGGIDDYVALCILLKAGLNLAGVTITAADCFGVRDIELTKRILSLYNNYGTPVGLSSLEGKNTYPANWRNSAEKLICLPRLNSEYIKTPTVSEFERQGEKLLLSALQSYARMGRKVTIVMTGPSTNLAYAIEQDPTVVSAIKGS